MLPVLRPLLLPHLRSMACLHQRVGWARHRDSQRGGGEVVTAVSQRGIKRKLRDAKAELAFIHRIGNSAFAISAEARGGDWAALRQRLDEYQRYLDARAERITGCVRDLEAQLRGKARP